MKCKKALCYVTCKEPPVIFDDLERNGSGQSTIPCYSHSQKQNPKRSQPSDQPFSTENGMIFTTLGSVIPFIFALFFLPRRPLMPERLEPYNHDCHIFVMPSLLVFDYLRVHLTLTAKWHDWFLPAKRDQERIIHTIIRLFSKNARPAHTNWAKLWICSSSIPTPHPPKGGSCFISLNNFISVFCQTK